MQFKSLFSHDKIAIGMVHLAALPGTPMYDEKGGMDKIYHQAQQDVASLQKADFDAILFCNEWDMPYEASVSSAVVASYSAVVASLKGTLKVPFGINMLLDAEAAVAVSAAAQAQFIRCFLSNAYVGDMGLLIARPDRAMRLRRQLYMQDNLCVLANVTAGFAAPLAERNLTERVSGAIFIDLADGIIVSGPAAGVEAKLDDLKDAERSCGEKPLIVGTGVSAANVETMLEHAFGVIVGTAIKVGKETLNQVDPAAAGTFMQQVKSIRGS